MENELKKQIHESAARISNSAKIVIAEVVEINKDQLWVKYPSGVYLVESVVDEIYKKNMDEMTREAVIREAIDYFFDLVIQEGVVRRKIQIHDHYDGATVTLG